MHKVREQAPCLINNHLLVLNYWPKELLLEQIDLTRSPCWVSIHNLPPNLINKENARRFGMMLGGIIAHDEKQFEEGDRANVLRVKVNLDITQLLLLWCNGRRQDCGYQCFHITYDKLPEFCYYCGVIAHNDKGCQK